MKKILAILLTILLCAFIVPASAFSSPSSTQAKIAKSSEPNAFNESDAELGEGVLRELGMSEEWLQRIPDEKKAVFAHAEGCKNSEDDDSFHKELFVTKNKDDSCGAYDIIAIFKCNNMNIYRGADAISISGKNLVFDMSSFYAGVFYDSTCLQGNQLSTEKRSESYDMYNLAYTNDLQGGVNTLMFKYRLPGYLKQSDENSSVDCGNSNLEFMVIVSAYISTYNFESVFDVQASYFHQKLPYREIDISTGFDDDLFPLFYRQNTITTDTPLVHIPS